MTNIQVRFEDKTGFIYPADRTVYAKGKGLVEIAAVIKGDVLRWPIGTSTFKTVAKVTKI